MDAFSDPLVDEIVNVSSAQSGKTECALNCLGYIIDVDPGPILYVLPTEKEVDDFSKDRLATMIRDTPVLFCKASPEKYRSSDNAILHKSFPGGYVVLRGSNSPSGLSSKPIRYVFLDEESRYKPSAGLEGNPAALAKKRTQTFWNRKIYRCSTPGIAGTCSITDAYNETDQRHRFLPCPDCGSFQVLFFSAQLGDENRSKKRAGGIKWDKGPKGEHLPETVYYECEHCGYHIHQTEINGMDMKGEWRASKPFNGKAGFRINELYSPWSKWVEIVQEFLDVKHSKNVERMKAFVNLVLGEAFREQGETVNGVDLLGRRERWEKLPNGVLILTAGVDIQDNRIEYAIWGWGQGYERWLVDAGQFMGDTQREGPGSVWEQAGTYLTGFTSEREDGIKVRVQSAGVDTGHRTEQVYRFTKVLASRRFYAIKGEGGAHQAFVKLSQNRNKVGGTMHRVAVDMAKKELYDALKIIEPGPLYIHFPSKEFADEVFFEQLTSEERVVRYVNNFPQYVWRKKDAYARNEALDVTVYAHAALAIIRPNFDLIEKNLKLQHEHIEKEQKPEPAKNTPRPNVPNQRRPGGWMGGWKL